jgi:uncharacterized protein YabE (DUF348 family)
MSLAVRQLARVLTENKLLLVLLAVIVVFALLGQAFGGTYVKLEFEGQKSWIKTRARTVGELLEEQKIKVKNLDVITPGLNQKINQGIEIKISSAKSITVQVMDEVIVTVTTERTVKDALARLGIHLKPADKVKPNKETLVKTGMVIEVIPVYHRLEVEKIPIPFKKITQPDRTMLVGKKVLVRRGKPGLLARAVDLLFEGQKLIKKTIVAEQIVTAPVNELTKVGTAKKLARATSPVTVSRGASNKGASRSKALGGKVLVMIATAYAPNHGPGVGTRTATGARARRGIVAVDPRVIPLGTRLYVSGYGYAIAADTGGAIKGNRIDLCFDTVAEAIRFGRRRVTVRILN